MNNELWMLVTSDQYELPLIIAETAKELADRAGVTSSTVQSNAYRYRAGKQKHSRYQIVSLEEGD